MTEPLVSVVMSVYNGEPYLAASLESVLSQEGVDFEFILVDDGSTDRSPEVLREYAARDARIRVITQENAGLTRALIRGCAEARGEFIARQDVDDLSEPGRLAKQAAALRENPRVAVVSCWTRTMGPEGEHLAVTRFPEGVDQGTRAVMEESRSAVHGSAMFRTQAYRNAGGYRPQFYFAQDTDLWFRIADQGAFLFLPEVLYAFRVSAQGITSRYRAAQFALYAIAKELRRARQERGSEAKLLDEAEALRPGRMVAERGDSSAGHWFLARALIKNGDPAARKYAREFVRQRPFSLKGWASLLQSLTVRT